MYRFNPPPGWPAPPPGWVPPPGWQPDAAWPAAPAGWPFWVWAGPPIAAVAGRRPRSFGRPWRLDGEVERTAAGAADRWTARVAWLPLLAVVVTIFASQLLVRTLLGSLSSAGSVVRVGLYLLTSVAAYGIMLFACYRIGEPVARASGGMGNAFGWRRPSLRDVGIGIGWAVASNIVRVIVVLRIVTLVPALSKARPNLRIPHHASVVGIAVVGLISVVVAPPVEELVFRGLVLRTLMRHRSFWTAALISSLLFGLLHTYEVNTAASVIVLLLNITFFGLAQCLLVRWRGGLGPAMVSHAASNAVALLIAVLAAG